MSEVQKTVFDKEDEKICDANLKIYESARGEIIQRLVLRDSALGLYIVTIGTYLSATISLHFGKEVEDINIGYALVMMLPFPIVCLAFSLIIIQHHLVIGRLGFFVIKEINWHTIGPKISRHWDNSDAFLNQASFLILLRMYAQGLVLCLPLIYSIIFYSRFLEKAKHLGLFWYNLMILNFIADMSIIFAIVYLHYYAHTARKRELKSI